MRQICHLGGDSSLELPVTLSQTFGLTADAADCDRGVCDTGTTVDARCRGAACNSTGYRVLPAADLSHAIISPVAAAADVTPLVWELGVPTACAAGGTWRRNASAHMFRVPKPEFPEPRL